MSTPNQLSNFGELQSLISEQHGLSRVSPKKEMQNGTESSAILGANQLLTRQILEFLWRDLQRYIESQGGMDAALLHIYPDLTDVIHSNDIRVSCIELSEVMVEVFTAGLSHWINTMECFDIDSDFEQLGTYMNYKSILEMGGSRIGLFKPNLHLLAGLKTGISESWRVVYETCRTYEATEGKSIDIESLCEIALNSYSLLTKIASSHVRLLSNYISCVTHQDIFALDPCDAPMLRIVGESPHRRLEMSDVLLNEMRQRSFAVSKPEYSGCPALYSQTRDGVNLVEDLHKNIVVPCALRLLLPHLRQA